MLSSFPLFLCWASLTNFPSLTCNLYTYTHRALDLPYHYLSAVQVINLISESNLQRRKGAQDTRTLNPMELELNPAELALFHTVPAGDISDLQNQWNSG